ncbi:MAG: PEP-CTERM sorting domain-containing protein [Planctomycetota bacterium]
MFRIPAAAAVVALVAVHASASSITDFTEWTLFDDPSGGTISPFLSGSSTMTTATLSAGNGDVPAADDIGFATTNANTVAASTSGFAFDKDASFSLAVTYDLTFAGSPAAVGNIGLGFGIGEERSGENSVGVAILTIDGSPTLFFGGARRVDNDTILGSSLVPATLSGTLFVTYDAFTGNVTVGGSQTKDANMADPLGSVVFGGVQPLWNEQDLLASFFINGVTFGGGWDGGEADAVFTNFRVLSGSPYVIPEPASLALLAASFGLIASRRRRA